ncbi:MAG: FMN-binding negative transcriptional regulator [Pseudomonadota bacterium]
MYTPRSFAEHDLAKLQQVVDDYPFGLLVTAHESVPTVTHLPWLLDRSRGEFGVLQAHMARANPHWKQLEEEGSALVVFQGPHDYVSPAWYESPNLVPTWNYIAVHACGPVRVLHSETDAAATVSALTARFESLQESPWRLDMESSTNQRMLSAIVAFEVEVIELSGKFKLNQNRGEADRKGVVDALADTNAPLAAAMSAVDVEPSA